MTSYHSLPCVSWKLYDGGPKIVTISTHAPTPPLPANGMMYLKDFVLEEECTILPFVRLNNTPYRSGYNGKEYLSRFGSGVYDYGSRLYHGGVGRLMAKYPVQNHHGIVCHSSIPFREIDGNFYFVVVNYQKPLIIISATCNVRRGYSKCLELLQSAFAAFSNKLLRCIYLLTGQNLIGKNIIVNFDLMVNNGNMLHDLLRKITLSALLYSFKIIS